jgi:hypothetical protein
MKMSLMKKLSVGFLLTVVGAILIASFVSNYMVGKKFNNYLVDEHKDKVNKIVVTAQDLYNDTTGFTNFNKEELSRYALLEELYIQVKDTNGNVVFDSGNSHLQHKNMMESMMGNMMKNGMGKYSDMSAGEYKEETHPLVKDKKNIGTLGHSYGGNTVLFLAAIDERISFSCASGSACTYENRILNNVGIEMASVIPNFHSKYDIFDLVSCIAPRRLLIVSAEDDKYSRDASYIVEKASSTYLNLNALSNLHHKRYQGGHGLTKERFDFIIEWLDSNAKHCVV